MAQITIAGWMVEWAFGLLVVQLLAAIAWGIRVQMSVNALKADLVSIKDWQQERMKPIEEYYHRQEALTSRLVAVEEQSKSNARTLERIESKLDRLIEREQHP